MDKLIQNNTEVAITAISEIQYNLEKKIYEEFEFKFTSKNESSKFSFDKEFIIQKNGITIRVTPSSFNLDKFVCKIKPSNCLLIR